MFSRTHFWLLDAFTIRSALRSTWRVDGAYSYSHIELEPASRFENVTGGVFVGTSDDKNTSRLQILPNSTVDLRGQELGGLCPAG